MQLDEAMTWEERWLSVPRLMPYYDACHGDKAEAYELYQWNTRLAQALMGDISVFEVALRNAFDRQLRSDFGDRWLFDDDSPVRKPIMRVGSAGIANDQNRFNRKEIVALVSRKDENADAMVSGLMFGFWARLVVRSHERELWIP